MILEKMQFVLGFCFSPPLHASEEELEAYYAAAVKPFVAVAYRFPDIPMTLFFSGPLLEWLQNQHSEYLTVLSEMIKRKQVEVLGGGFYEPILPLIPPTDRLGQIEELTTLIRKLLGKRPRGLWLTKGVWDPGLVVHLTGSGMEYTFLEEVDFRKAGLTTQQIGLPRLTEQQGRLLTVFPHHSELAQRVQDGDFEPFVSIIPARRRKDRQLLTLFFSVEGAADGAFFTRGESGLEGFLNLIRSYYPEVEPATASGFLKKAPQALERSYFAGTTYEDLCRRTGQNARGSAGQTWKQFLANDEAANRLYNKMVYVHLLVTSLRGDKYKKKSAYDDLWKAQNWLGYLGAASDDVLALHRQKSFAALLNAEALLRDRTDFVASLTAQDFDLDGVQEYLFQGNSYNLYVDAVGGQVFEWDFLDRPWNFIGARPAVSGVPQSQGFVDRFFRIDSPDTDAAAFFDREYRLLELDREHRSFQLMAVDSLEGHQGRQPLRLKKTFRFAEEVLSVEYELELLTGPSWEGWFSSEVTLSYPTPGQVTALCDGTEAEAAGYLVSDAARRTEQSWAWTPNAAVRFDAGRLTPRWWVILQPGETWRARISLGWTRED